jgi:hypothetical protein
VYTQLSQPHVLSVLPVDEQLRLARRLVATREDAAALRVLDGLLGNDTMRNLYGRQLADCLLGLFTTIRATDCASRPTTSGSGSQHSVAGHARRPGAEPRPPLTSSRFDHYARPTRNPRQCPPPISNSTST